MVQVVKRNLRKILWKSKLTYEEPLAVCEIEPVFSSRPLCYVHDNSIEEVITPSHLFLDRRVLTKFDSNFNENNMDFDALSKRVHYLQTLIYYYWNRWRREYLFQLRERHKLTNVVPDCLIKLREVVFIEETHVPGSRWKINQVEEFVNKSKLCVTGKEGHYFIKRPVNKLYPLEIRNSNNSVVKK